SAWAVPNKACGWATSSTLSCTPGAPSTHTAGMPGHIPGAGRSRWTHGAVARYSPGVKLSMLSVLAPLLVARAAVAAPGTPATPPAAPAPTPPAPVEPDEDGPASGIVIDTSGVPVLP